jgi:hypothetical protein
MCSSMCFMTQVAGVLSILLQNHVAYPRCMTAKPAPSRIL